MSAAFKDAVQALQRRHLHTGAVRRALPAGPQQHTHGREQHLRNKQHRAATAATGRSVSNVSLGAHITFRIAAPTVMPPDVATKQGVL